MRAHDSFLNKLLKLGDTMFYIPVFQRNYDWDTDNCEQLMYDLEKIALSGREHFIGNIVYVSTGTATEQNYNIIDGQQRITSVMLLMKAMYDLTDDTKLQRQIRNGYLLNAEDEDDVKIKLKQVEADRSVFEKLVLHKVFNEEDFTESEKRTNIYRNYQFFRNRVIESPVAISDLYNAVAKFEIIDVLLTTEDPQEVFESMNSTGKNLTNTDLLRNYLLMALPHALQETLYNKYWAGIEKNVGKEMMEQYMVHYLIMKRKSDSINLRNRSSKVNKNNLYDCFKLYFTPDNKKDGGIETLMADMYRYSSVYRRIVNNDSIVSELDKAIYELIYELKADQAAIFLLYLLDYQKTNKISDEEMLQAVKACISYVFRVRMFKGSPSSQFFSLAIQYFDRGNPETPFVDRVWNALTSGQGSYRFPKDRELIYAFETKDMYLEFKPQMIRYILYKFERENTKEVVEPENVTIEHILPQDSSEWRAHLSELHDETFIDNIHKIGNLTLTKMNSEASNDPFEKKKLIYEKSGYAITRAIAKMPDWSSKEILERCKAMAQEAIVFWPLPEKYNQDLTSNAWHNMDDSTEERYNQLIDSIKEYDKSIYEDQKKLYLNLVKNKKIILSIVPGQSSLYVMFNAKKEELTPSDMLEDISQKGHWGVGDSRIKVDSEEDVMLALNYAGQILSKKG